MRCLLDLFDGGTLLANDGSDGIAGNEDAAGNREVDIIASDLIGIRLPKWIIVRLSVCVIHWTKSIIELRDTAISERRRLNHSKI